MTESRWNRQTAGEEKGSEWPCSSLRLTVQTVLDEERDQEDFSWWSLPPMLSPAFKVTVNEFQFLVPTPFCRPLPQCIRVGLYEQQVQQRWCCVTSKARSESRYGICLALIWITSSKGSWLPCHVGTQVALCSREIHVKRNGDPQTDSNWPANLENEPT